MREARHHLFLVAATAFWAGNFIVGGLIADSVSPLLLTTLRWALATVPLFILATLIERPRWREVLREWPMLLLLAMLGLVGYALFTYSALAATSSVSAALVNSVSPAVIAIVAVVITREQLRSRAVVGLVLSLVGVVIVLVRLDGGGIDLDLGPGTLFMFGAVVVWVAYTVLGRLLSAPPVAATAVQSLIATIGLVPVTLLLGDTRVDGGATWLGIAFIALFPSVLSYLFWNLAVRGIGAARAGIYLNLVPFFAALLGLVVGETLTLMQVLGGILVVIGVVLTARRGRVSPPTDPDR